MPGYCCVPICSNEIGGHLFPHNIELKKRWLQSIKRVTKDPNTGKMKDWEPSKHSVVCFDHFTEDDYITKRGLSFVNQSMLLLL